MCVLYFHFMYDPPFPFPFPHRVSVFERRDEEEEEPRQQILHQVLTRDRQHHGGGQQQPRHVDPEHGEHDHEGGGEHDDLGERGEGAGEAGVDGALPGGVRGRGSDLSLHTSVIWAVRARRRCTSETRRWNVRMNPSACIEARSTCNRKTKQNKDKGDRGSLGRGVTSAAARWSRLGPC